MPLRWVERGEAELIGEEITGGIGAVEWEVMGRDTASLKKQ